MANKVKIIKWAKWAIIVYCAIGIALFYLQNNFVLHPQKLANNFIFTGGGKYTESFININENTTINVVNFLSTDTVTRGIVLYFHGNKENIQRYAKFAPAFTKMGYEVCMVDYPSFGKSTGDFSEALAYEVATQVYKKAAVKFPPNKIIVYGKSLGTGFATYVAANNTVATLILETPYLSIPALFSSYAPIYPTQQMSNFKIPQHEYLPFVQAPIFIFHGTSDGVVPYSQGKKLASLNQKAQLITLPKGTHHNLTTFKMYQNKLVSILRP
jgi:uncharacterized protein